MTTIPNFAPELRSGQKLIRALLVVSGLIAAGETCRAWEFDESQRASKEQKISELTPLQKKITQKDGTEKPFDNEYWDLKKDGIYVDLVFGEPLFSSKDKYDSGTGWPSFTKPLVMENIVEKEDKGLFTTRTEIRSRYSDSHLGHVFNDGPQPTGLRYCMNSAALKFIPKEKLVEAGYGEFLSEFEDSHKASMTAPKSSQVAVFAGGCFWCMQPPYDKLKGKGVISTRVGYTGGTKENPTYEETSAGNTGHREAVEVTFDPAKVSYAELLRIFWRNIDPYDSRGQFCDKGEVYTSAVFYANDQQKKDYEDSLKEIQKQGIDLEKIATKLLPQKTFYPAEDYHQSYYKKNPFRYKFYRFNCGRDKRLTEVWGKK